MKQGGTHSEETKIRIGATRAKTQGQPHICQAVFGKPHSELSEEEYRRFRQLTKAAAHYRRYADNTQRLRETKRVRKQALLDALGWAPRCVRCGYDTYIGALDFHHLDATEKDGDKNVFKGDWSKALTEARKCQLICANCHREVHRDEPVGSRSGRPRKADPLLERYLRASGLSEAQIQNAMSGR